MMAMFGTMQHAAQSNAWFGALSTNSPLRRGGLAGWGLWLRRDFLQQFVNSGGALFLMFLVPLAMQAASRLGKSSGGQSMENCMGLMQWIIVAGIAVFFSSYIFDLAAP